MAVLYSHNNTIGYKVVVAAIIKSKIQGQDFLNEKN
jgi:hypothetical protein